MIDDQGVEQLKATVKDTVGLRDMLFDEIDSLRGGRSTPKQAQMVARLASTIIDSVRIEIEAFKHPLSKEFTRLPDYPHLEANEGN